MIKIRSLFQGISKQAFGVGDVNISGFNVCPTTQVALATTGLTLSKEDLKKYDFFVVDQTSADTDIIVIPSALEVGSQINFFALDIVVFKVSTGETHNAQAATTSWPCVAGDWITYTKVSSTAWIVNKRVAAGTVSAPSPA